LKEVMIKLLKQSRDYISGESLSRQLGVSRSAVWKTIQSLRQDGYPIEAVTNRGYRLDQSADILNETELELLRDDPAIAGFIRKVCFAQMTDSTNQMAKEAAIKNWPSGSLFVAEIQTSGRGRRGRSWLSDHEQGLWFTILLRPEGSPDRLARITLFMGLCTAEALRGLGVAAGIKWPNDLVSLSTGKKMGGILTETTFEEQTPVAVVAGIGLNVNTESFPPELSDVATSFMLDSGRRCRRIDVLNSVLQEMASRYPDFNVRDDWLSEYRADCVTLGQEVQVVCGDGTRLDGLATDLDPAGELIIQDAAGNLHIVRSGEVSIRR
jgi:BirA family transcriptional regulator, biotin operon repressor / biotin---[acetyl-CoA-carboxylase] ligase